MILQRTSAPVLACLVQGPRGIAPAVEAVIGQRGLAGIAPPLSPKTLDLVGLAIMEVLHTVLEQCGDRGSASSASVELWIEPKLAVLAVGYAGPPLPAWLLGNWDRSEEPAPEALPARWGWGWLLVREALDGVSAARCGSRRLLFLEKRL